MKDNELNSLISSIQSYRQLSTKTHPALSLESLLAPQCPSCKIFFSIIEQQERNSDKMCQQYNGLLSQTHRLIDISCDFIDEQRRHYEEQIADIGKECAELQERVNQLQAELGRKTLAVEELGVLLLNSYQRTVQIQDKYSQQTQNLQQMHIKTQTQQARQHKRQKSQCNKLQTYNLLLSSQNEHLKSQNLKLKQCVGELREYISRMEQDLANFNVRSPRVINERCRGQEQHQDSNSERLGLDEFEGDCCSIQQESPIKQKNNGNQSLQQFSENFIQQSNQSFRSSFVNKRQVLREVLNISGQTSNYFQFRTKQRIQGSSAYIIKSNLNDQKNMNTVNVNQFQKTKQKQIQKQNNNILQIKQFQVNQAPKNQNIIQCLVIQPQKQFEPKLLSQCEKQNGRQIKEQKNTKPPQNNMIDPYYAFFVLTIQCIKLNWRDMNEVANIQLDQEWAHVIDKNIPINLWHQYLKSQMFKKVRQFN